MTTIAELSPKALDDCLSGPGLSLNLGAARVRVRTPVEALQSSLRTVYGAFPFEPPEGFFPVTAVVEPARGVRQFFRPQIRFLVDATEPFEPFPADTHLPLLEWGLNFCLAERLNQHLLLHSGVLERDGVGIVFPGVPGAGKSTLTAALACRGFRLLSDEFGVVRLDDGMLLPMVRPAALKNASIDVMRDWAPQGVYGPVFPRTRKGDVCHMAPSPDSVARRHEAALPGLVVFPRFQQGVQAQLRPVPPARVFAKLATHSFNYQTLGARSFDAVTRMVRTCRSHELVYGNLAEAQHIVEDLVSAVARARRVGDGEASLTPLAETLSP